MLVGALADMSIPQGEMMDQRYGGQESFRLLVDKVRSAPFTGYLESSLALEGHDSSGLIIFDGSKPVYAVYAFRPSGNESVEIIYRGERAMEFVCGDSLYANSLIELHRLKDLSEMKGVMKGRDPSRDFARSLENFYQTRLAESERGAKRKAKGAVPVEAEVLSDSILDFHRQHMREKASPSKHTIEIDVELHQGESYLVEELSRDYGHGIFGTLVEQGLPGLGITRANPRVLRSRMEGAKGLSRSQLMWLTDHETRNEATVSPSLEKIMVVVEEFLARHEGATVLIDDLQYLISSNTFEGAVRFIRSLVDKVSEKNAIFLLSVDPNSLSVQERSIIEREMTVVREK